MKKTYWFLILSVMVLSLLACTTDDVPKSGNEMPPAQEEPTPEQPDNQDDVDEDVTDVEFESQIEEPIVIEGMEEPITLNLYDYESAPFITYVPSDLVAEEASSGEGDSYWFYANYVGEKIEDVYLQIYFYSENLTEQPSIEDEDSTYALLLEDMELVNPEERYYDWAIEEYQSPEGSRQVMLGEHSGQYFVIVLNSQVEYSEGFVPRANKIIDHFYWRDTEEYLTQ